MLPAVQAPEQIAAVVSDMLPGVLKVNTAEILAVCFPDLGCKPSLLQLVPFGISQKCAEVVTVRQPVFLLPAAVARSSMDKLV